MKVDLSGQVALVTGAARGIGQAIADALAENGAGVVYSDVDAAGAEDAAARTKSAALRIDVSDQAEVEREISRVIREFGRLDIVVNNAGINTLTHRVEIDKFPAAEWDRNLKVDLPGLFYVSQAAARHMS